MGLLRQRRPGQAGAQERHAVAAVLARRREDRPGPGEGGVQGQARQAADHGARLVHDRPAQRALRLRVQRVERHHLVRLRRRLHAAARRGRLQGQRRGVWTGAGQDTKKVLCVSEEETGLAYRLEGETPERPYAKMGSDLVLRTISKVGWYEYITEYRFADDGQISVRLGATGDLAPRDYTTPDQGWPIGPGQTDYSVNHYHSAFWRVDFNIGGYGTEKVEQYDTAPTGERGRRGAIYATSKTDVATEATLNTDLRRWWRVVSPTSRNADGHFRSYELELGANDAYEAHPETQPDVTFTQYKPCEKFATFNQDPECAGTTILEYTNGERLTDPVMWVRVGFHHVPRDEDQSPMPVHWQGFDLVPRDFTAQNPLAPADRLGVNGDGVS
ncbi:copper amine oxidase [Phytohabitans suffuscus]|uniref:copper amine oxidase n=1 Tax=Phytohabitans suffuscus TaxID=624315 RepID=UPI002F965A0C